MANLRTLKKEIDYCLEEVSKDMNPAEPHNASLVRKHYAALRREIVEGFEGLFAKLSKINEGK